MTMVLPMVGVLVVAVLAIVASRPMAKVPVPVKRSRRR
jgi:Tfp pilus assembly protein PilE